MQQRKQTFIEYDVIFIGQLGTSICNIFYNSNILSYKCLVINNCTKILEPALLPTQSPIININKNHFKYCDFDSQRIFKLQPDDNLILMNNKKCYRYRYLVYATSVQDWVDYAMIQNLNQALHTNYSFVYSNVLKSQPSISHADIIFQKFETLKKLQTKNQNISNSNEPNIQKGQNQRVIASESEINLVFYIPNPPHGGYDNINVLYKFDEFMETFNKKLNGFSHQFNQQNNKHRNKQKQKEEAENFIKLNFILLLEGKDIFPQCFAIDTYIREKILERGIKIMENHHIDKIDYLRRKIFITRSEGLNQGQSQDSRVSISIKNKTSINYEYLYIILQHRPPQLLSTSNINPYNSCHKYLFNKQYKNIFIIGSDIFPTTHSFQAINYQSHIIASNLLILLKWNKDNNSVINQSNVNNNNSVVCRRLNQYNGFTSFLLWIRNDLYICMQHQYENGKVIVEDMGGTKRKKEKTYVMRKRNYITDMPHCCLSVFQAPLKRFTLGMQISLFYNLKSYGAPYYFFVPEDPEIIP